MGTSMTEFAAALREAQGALALVARIRETFGLAVDADVLEYLCKHVPVANPPERLLMYKISTPKKAAAKAVILPPPVASPSPPPPPPPPPVVTPPAVRGLLPLCTVCGKEFTPPRKRKRILTCESCQLDEIRHHNEQVLRLNNAPIEVEKQDPSWDIVPADKWPSAKIFGFPCASCKYGAVESRSESGYMCDPPGVPLARTCAPWGPAWKYEKKET